MRRDGPAGLTKPFSFPAFAANAAADLTHERLYVHGEGR